MIGIAAPGFNLPRAERRFRINSTASEDYAECEAEAMPVRKGLALDAVGMGQAEIESEIIRSCICFR